jgi:hypothetical protein
MKRKTNDRHPPMPAAGRASARSANRPVSRVVPSGVSRGSFRVASALDVLGASVPEVYQAPAKRSAPSSVKRSVAPAPPLSLSSSSSPPSTGPARRAETLRPVQASKPAPDRSTVRPTSVDLRPEQTQSCKARPPSSAGGSGASRPFVPWCSKRS